MKEAQLQTSIAKYIDLCSNSKGILWTATAGGMRTHMSVARKMKAQGLKRGVPDLLFFEPNDKYKGLMIELKIKGNYPTKEQKEWIKNLNDRGYFAAVCTGFDEFEKVFNQYFNKEC